VADRGAEPPPVALPVLPGAVADALLDVLGEAAGLGFLGPGPIEPHVAHAARFAAVLRPASTVLDLGTGGGIPGLVLAALRPEAKVVLLDARRQRTDFLERAVGRLGWSGRVTVVAGRAEEVGRSPEWRGRVPAVVARSFGSPATTAECAAALLLVGGQLVVSEPPDSSDDRWPAAGLALVGLAVDGRDHGLVSFTQVSPCPQRFARGRQDPDLFHVKRH
jgi:16S rRNA (guanine527-N7)-methyltransferase